MIEVVMPQMGESIVEGTLTRWLKKPGDKVERDEPLFEISTDKVDTEIPSPAAGVLAEILVQEGETVAIKTLVAKISEGGEAAAPAAEKKAAPAEPPPSEKVKDIVPEAPAAAPTQATPAPAAPAPAAPQQDEAVDADEVVGPLSPLVRKMAREYNIDLGQVRGTGAGGRITKQDLETYMAAQGARTIESAPAPAAAAATPATAPKQAAPAPVAPLQPLKDRVEPLSIMRQKIAEHMVNSKRTSPHVTTIHRVDMTKIAKLRDKAKNEFKNRNGFSLTFLSFVTQATAQALRAFPIVNASIEGTNIRYHGDINIGIAVALDGGLIVPIIKNADEKNTTGLQRSIADLANRARSKQLKPDDISGGTFSITNFGSFGSLFATPVINQPQVAILGIGSVTKEAVVQEDDSIAIRSMMYLALTFDHRLIDGALADQFCQKIKQILENWSEQIL